MYILAYIHLNFKQLGGLQLLKYLSYIPGMNTTGNRVPHKHLNGAGSSTPPSLRGGGAPGVGDEEGGGEPANSGGSSLFQLMLTY